MANTWLDWIVGSDPKEAGAPKLQWANLPESWGVFVLIAFVALIAFGVFWLYRREMNVCPMPIKLLMAGLRFAVLLFLIALFLKPSVFFQQVNEIKRTIPLLRDSSLSIAKGDVYRDPAQVNQLIQATGIEKSEIESGIVDRAALLNAAFKKAASAVDAMRDKGAIQVVDFADGSKPIAVLPAFTEQGPRPKPDSTEEAPGASDTGMIQEAIPVLVPDGLGTDIWQALRTTLEDANKISAIVIASDFQHNGSENPIELAQRAASLGVPIYTIGLGDPNPPKNIAVNEVYVRNKAYPDEPFEVEALLQSSHVGGDGMPGKINVSLLQQRVDTRTGKLEPPQPVETKAVDMPETGGRIRVDFEHVLNLPGKYVFSVSTEALDQEANLEDNLRASSELEVVDEKVKVLLISGLPSWDFQQVQRLLQRDQSISVSCWLQSMDESRPQEGNEPISRLPRSMEELGQYNVVILMDPNPQEFDRDWMELLKTFCRNKAGGVLFMAGPQFTGEFVTLNRLDGIRELLPIQLGDVEFIDTTQILASAKSNDPIPMKVVDHNLDHAVMSFRSEAAENQKIWSAMPGFFWSFPALSAKPTARVLLENSEQVNASGNQPLLVAGRFGAGSVLYMGIQGTWRWRRVGLQAQYFDRFWIQVVRYLVETRSLQGSRRGFIDADRTEYELGDRVMLVARVLDQQFQPTTEPVMNAKIQTTDGRTINLPLKLLPQQKGRYEGTFIAQRTGNYEATIDFGNESTEQGSLVDPIAFRVVPPSAESGAYWLNEKLMNELALQSGGQSFRLDEIDKLAEALPRVSKRIEFKSPPKPIWDMSNLIRILAFSLPVVLLCVEWALRKWYKLL